MNILLIGSGGREHALAWKIAQSPKLAQLYTVPGNPGTAEIGINLPGNPEDLSSIVEIALQKQIDLAVIGPEAPLAAAGRRSSAASSSRAAPARPHGAMRQ